MQVDVSGVMVDLIDDDDSIVKAFNMGKDWERETRAAWGSLVRVGDGTVLDVGAYTGIYSITTAKMRPAPVIAFEPHMPNFRRMVDNVKLARANVSPMMLALSKTAHAVTLNGLADDALDDMATLEQSRGTRYTAIAVPFDAVNERRPWGRIAFAKIDVEGHELDVLTGMQTTIVHDRPLLLIEALTCDASLQTEAFMALMRYRLDATFDGRNMLFVPR